MKEIELEIIALDPKSQGIGKYKNKKILCDNVYPGDVVKATIPNRLHRKTKAKVTSFVKQSMPRIDPKCFYFGDCGGCKYQNISYEDQLKLKQDKILQAFVKHEVPLELEIPKVLAAPKEWYYRNKMEFSFGHRRWLTTKETELNEKYEINFALGMHSPYTFDKILDISECFLLTPETPDILNLVRNHCLINQLQPYNQLNHQGYLRFLCIRTTQNNEIMVNFVTKTEEPEILMSLVNLLTKDFKNIKSIINTIQPSMGNIAIGEKEILLHGQETIIEKLFDLNFEVSASSFFQPNTLAAEKVYTLIKDFAEINSNENILDLYCGVGTISLFLAKLCHSVVGFEINPSAIESANKNKTLNNINNCNFHVGDLKDIVKQNSNFNRKDIDLIVIDPPRAGLHPDVIQKLRQLKIKKIIYVSCNPLTLATDLKSICHNGLYKITKIQPVDMLPQTNHLECVTRLDLIL